MKDINTSQIKKHPAKIDQMIYHEWFEEIYEAIAMEADKSILQIKKGQIN
jgi:isocitrate dehydrogenase